MEENEITEGDCVQVSLEHNRFNGCVGRVLTVRVTSHPTLVLVRFDDEARYFNIKYLIPRDTMACAEE